MSENSYLKKQEDLLKHVISSIYETPIGDNVGVEGIARNIRELKEEIKVAKEDDLGGLYFQLNLQYNLATKFSKPVVLPDTDSPYFGHMKLEEDGKTREIFLGHIPFIPKDRSFRIIDWKNSPLSRVYYQYEEGEEYELELPGKTLEGTILEKSVLTVESKSLIRVDQDEQSFVKVDGQWTTLEKLELKLSGGQGSAVRSLGTGRTGFNSPDVISLLDKAQFDLLNRSSREPLLIIGGAGSGKTTVALYRIARLCAKKKFYPAQCMVVVPNRGLIRLSRNLLSKIGMQKVHVKTGPSWIENTTRRLIEDLPKRVCQSTPLSASLIKRHLSFVELLEEHANKKQVLLGNRLKEIENGEELYELFNKKKRASSYEKLCYIQSQKSNLTSLQSIFIEDEKKKLFNVKAELEDILFDKELLLTLNEKSEGVITKTMVEQCYDHSVRQFQYIEDFSEHDQTGLDGKSVNEATPFDINGTMDEEDFAIMLKLLHLNTGELNIKKFKHIVLDEAQELSPIELMCFSYAISEKGTFTVAGDAAQQIDKTISFSSWDNVLDYLNVENVKAQELTVSYRSPKSIIDFSHHVLGDLINTKPPVAKRSGGPVIKTLIQHRAHASTILYEQLDELMRREPKASVAIICNEMKQAREFYNELKELGKVRIIEDSEFNFSPGIDITNVDQIRGLEFDYVILPDLDLLTYPDTPRSRKRLHLAATRAIHQLWVMHSKTPTRLIEGAF